MDHGAKKPVIGIIGGSGVYDIDGLENVRWQRVASSFGEPSDEMMFAELDGQPVVFLPRHGRGHPLSPADVNYRANIDAMKRAGVTEILSVSAVGSLKEELAPGTFVLVDQFIDRTIHRKKSFFGRGCVAHVSMAHPTCPRLMGALAVPPARRTSPSSAAAPTLRWKDRNSPAWRSQSFTAVGGPT